MPAVRCSNRSSEIIPTKRLTGVYPQPTSYRVTRVRGFCVMESSSFAGCSVLIVEDEALLALDLRQSFEAVGAYVFTATQFAQSLTLAEHPDLALAVLDYRIADETSVTVGRRLEARGIPFLFYSAYDDMLAHWPDAVLLNKPTPSPILIEKVAALLRGRYRSPDVQLTAPPAYRLPDHQRATS
jgi:DNA-binding response OmpR family regulator